MIENIINELPKEVRDKCKVKEDKLVIPTRLRSNEIYGKISDKLIEEENNLEKGMYYTADICKPPLKTITQLLIGKGR